MKLLLKEIISGLHKLLFFIVIFLIPLNLGKHFIFRWSFVKGLLVDYLVPTLFVTDILILGMLILWFIDIWFFKSLKFLKRNSIFLRILLLFVTSVGLSVWLSIRFFPAFFAFLRLILYILLFLYMIENFNFKKDFPLVVRILAAAVFLLGFLAIFQWRGQGSVFDNYLFFGEQPYSTSTPGVAVENVFGIAKIPVYGTFRHPNVFGGFLSMALIWLLLYGKKMKFWLFFVTTGVIALVLTFSQVAWLAFLLALVFIFLIYKYGRKGVLYSLILTLLVVGFSFTLPFFSRLGDIGKHPSVYLRSNLQISAFRALVGRIPFGVGLNNSTVVVEDFMPPSRTIRFLQPVHNIFILTLLESGVYALLFFVLMLMLVLYKLLKSSKMNLYYLSVSIFQILILGGFDHYLLTANQMQLVFWLTLGFALSYTYSDEE